MTSDFPRTLRVGILVFEDLEPLDVWGFIQAFSIARFIGTGYGSPAPYPFEIVLISEHSRGEDASAMPGRIKSYNGPYVAPDMFRDDAPDRDIDLLMIPGGHGVERLLGEPQPKPEPTRTPEQVRALLDWVLAMDARVTWMTSVCTGAAILARSGVLDGKPATSNHEAFAWVTSYGPRVLWNNVSRWVDAGKYVTSAGVSAGTDMAFHLVSRLAGRAVAEQAALGAEYDWHRDPEQPISYPQQAKVPTSRK